ncbi:hypothetical protein KUTeg_014498 [Tegillarca granosa]|uniref:VWFA domain-containing protein n=1 Tax=Tegillarca granosa TaxID=220873 RepID=A0ABQ9ESD4_TEGGR|nr:hypothetical protein KUTeg_014498 [Tegillarca granosa]
MKRLKDRIRKRFRDNTEQREIECWELKADIVFVMDSSGSIGSQNFYLQKNFLVKFAEVFHIGPNDVQVSVVSFSTQVVPEFNLNTYQNVSQLVNAIKNIRYIGSSTNTDAAIRYVINNSFRSENGARPDVHKLMILLTDGQSNRPQSTIQESQRLHQTDIKSIAIGVGTGFNRHELNAIASDQSLVLTVNNYQSLENLQKDLIAVTTGDVTTCMDRFMKLNHTFIRCGYDKDDDEERCFIQCQRGYQPIIPIDGAFQCSSCTTNKFLSSHDNICEPVIKILVNQLSFSFFETVRQKSVYAIENL